MNANAHTDRALDSTDHAIDRALAALRHAEPRAGVKEMERRILNALEARAAAPSRSRLWLGWLSEIALAASVTLVVLTLGGWLFLHAHPAPQIGSGTVAPRRYPVEEATSPAPRAHDLATATRARHSHAPHPVPSTPDASTTSPTTPDEATLLADLHAPSHPAPPIPLTPEERALQALLRRRHGVDLASLSDLNPALHSRHEAAEAADFHAFFNPPLPPQPGDPE